MPQDEADFIADRLRAFDCKLAVAARVRVAFSTEEWAVIERYVSGVGAKELELWLSLLDDMGADTTRGADYVQLRYGTFLQSLSAEERKSLAEFKVDPVSGRYLRLVSRIDLDVREVVLAAFSRTLAETDERRSRLQLAEREASFKAAERAGTFVVYDLGDLDRRPWGGIQEAPQLPPEIESRKERVIVVVGYVITDKGSTTDVVIRKSSDSRYDQACVEAVRRWTFQPGLKNGKAVHCRVQVPLAFNPQ